MVHNTPSTQIFLFNFYNNCMKYRYYYFPYITVEETEAQIKKKKKFQVTQLGTYRARAQSGMV